MGPKHGSTASAIDFLRRDDRAAALLPAAQRHLQLRQDVLALVPAALRETCEVVERDDDTVLIAVPSASAAAKLRQTLPRLRDGLLDRGWQVTAIRMRVQPNGPTSREAPSPARSGPDLPSAGLAAFDRLTQGLQESPLKAAVDRLLTRRRA